MLLNGKNYGQKFFTISLLVLLTIVSFTYIPVAAMSSDEEYRDMPMVLISTDDSKYIAGEKINIGIIVKNQNEWPAEPILQYQVVYNSLNMPIVKGVVARDIQPDYAYNSSKTLPDYVPPGRYRIVVSLVSIEGKVLGSASSELLIEANYAGIARAVGLFFLYVFSVLMLFWLIYCFRFEKGKL